MRNILLISSLAIPTLVLGALSVACSSSSSGGDTTPTSTTTTTSTGTTPTDAGTKTDAAATSTATTDAGGPDLINGCSDLTDNTTAGVAAPGLNWGFSIGTDANHCSKIKVGQSVTWTGDFTTHPLVPHDSTGASTANNPITNGTTTGQGSVTVTFPTAGTYGYWCSVHTTNMMGQITVE